MSESLEIIRKKALKLSPAERERLATHLFESVHYQELNEIDKAWFEIAEQRYQNFKTGKAKGLSETEFWSA